MTQSFRIVVALESLSIFLVSHRRVGGMDNSREPAVEEFATTAYWKVVDLSAPLCSLLTRETQRGRET